jgi:hypothetical protein
MIFWNDYTPEYVAIVAIEAALLTTEKTPAPPKPPLPNCPQCKGTGKIKTGDGQGVTACPCTEREDEPKR